MTSLREKYLGWTIKRKLKHCGENVSICGNATILHPERISIGNNVKIERGCVINANDASSSQNLLDIPYISIGNNVHIKENVILSTYGGFIEFQNDIVIGQNSVIYGHGGILLSNNSGLGPLCLAIASNHNYGLKNIPFSKQGETKKGIIIEENVWCAGSVVICDGVTIEKNSVVGAGTVVRKSISSNSVVIGNPQKTLFKHS